MNKINLRISGRNYSERKNSFKAICKALRNQPVKELSWHEESEIFDYIEKNAKRYGMIKELEAIGMIAR